jgi:hypothetical protein
MEEALKEKFDIIRTTDTLEYVRHILEDLHAFELKYGWKIMLGLLFQECDYIEVHGYGTDCYLAKVIE